MSLKDIFQREQRYRGSFTAEDTIMTIGGFTPGQGDVGLLVQQVQANYVQNISRIYDLTENAVYFVGGRTQGAAGMQKVIGPSELTQTFYQKYGNVCDMADNDITLSGEMGCGTRFAATQRLSLRNCVINSFGFNVTSQDALIVENTQLVFNQLGFE